MPFSLRPTSRSTAVALSLGLISLGCAAAINPGAGGDPRLAAPAARPSAQPADEPTALLPLTKTEQQISSELREILTRLMGFGERNVAHEWELAAATDFIATTLEASSLEVRRHGFMHDGHLAQSLEVSLPGADPGAPVFVIGARLDSALGSPGADDNATGIAALVVLARQMAAVSRRRALRFVFFSDASNRTEPSANGATPYLQTLAREEVKVAAMLELSGLGFYSLAAQSQSYPEYAPTKERSTGDFVAFGGYAGLSPEPMVAFAQALAAQVSMPLVSMVFLPDEKVVQNSAHRVFAEQNIPSFILFDTHRYRYKDFGGIADTLERIDVQRMARVVAGLVAVLHEQTTRTAAPVAAAEASPALQPAGDRAGE